MFILQENVLWHEQDRPQLNAIFKSQSHVEKIEKKTNTSKHETSMGTPLETGYPKKLTPKTYEDLIRVMSTIQKNQDESYEIQRELEKYVSM